MTTDELKEILVNHEKWLRGETNGNRANLSGANLSGADLSAADLSGANLCRADLSVADLSGANLYRANLSCANLYRANLSCANLSGADLSAADLSGADLSAADLSGADLSGADLSVANLYRADLSGADLSGADLSVADLSGANLISNINFIDAHFEKTDEGYIAYKTFNSFRPAPKTWLIKKGAIIEEVVNFSRCQDCGSGINVATFEWVKKHCHGDIWKVLIRWEWLAGVCCPYNSDGKIRCEKVQLLEVVERR